MCACWAYGLHGSWVLHGSLYSKAAPQAAEGWTPRFWIAARPGAALALGFSFTWRSGVLSSWYGRHGGRSGNCSRYVCRLVQGVRGRPSAGKACAAPPPCRQRHRLRLLRHSPHWALKRIPIVCCHRAFSSWHKDACSLASCCWRQAAGHCRRCQLQLACVPAPSSPLQRYTSSSRTILSVSFGRPGAVELGAAVSLGPATPCAMLPAPLQCLIKRCEAAERSRLYTRTCKAVKTVPQRRQAHRRLKQMYTDLKYKCATHCASVALCGARNEGSGFSLQL